MTKLEKKPDTVLQEETDLEVKNTSDQQMSDSLKEIEQPEESKADSDAFDITKKFKHNQTSPKRQEVGRESQQQGREIPKRRELIGVTDKKVETKRLVYFLALCFGITWISEIFAIIPMYRSGEVELVTEAAKMISQMMLTPALAALVVRLMTREGLVKSGFQFNFFEHRFLFLFGWFGTTLSLIHI